jgi:hypothetical protein
MMDDDHKFYLSNLKKGTIKCIQTKLNIDNKETKVFRAISSNLEQFIFEDKNWLHGFELNSSNCNLFRNRIAFSFYTQYRNQVFIIECMLN